MIFCNSDINILCAFLLDTNVSILYDHAKYAILLVKVKKGNVK